jgi:hypothetical protein
MVNIINKYNLNSLLKYEFFKSNEAIQNMICHNLFLSEIQTKAKNTTIDILNNIEYKLINNNKWLIYINEDIISYGTEEDILKCKKKAEDLLKKQIHMTSKYDTTKEEYMKRYNDKLTMYKYYMFCLIYGIQNIQSLLEIDFMKKEIYKVERCDHRDYDDFNHHIKFKRFIFLNDYNYYKMIENSYIKLYSECSHFIIYNDSLTLNRYSTDEYKDDD